jgi:tight adherence protein C
MIYAIAAALLASGGLLLIARGALAPPISLKAFQDGSYRAARAEIGGAGGPASKAFAWLTLTVSPSTFVPAKLATDMRIMGKTDRAHMAEKLLMAIGGFAVGLLLPFIVRTAAGIDIPAGIVLVLGLAVAAGAYVFPDAAVKSQAKTRRKEFTAALASYLDLVQILIGAADGPESALNKAAKTGDGWAIIEIRAALELARGDVNLRPWDALQQLGEEIGVRELREFAMALSQTATSSSLPTTIANRAKTLRVGVLRSIEADARATTEKMDLPSTGMTVLLIVMLMYGAISQAFSGEASFADETGEPTTVIVDPDAGAAPDAPVVTPGGVGPTVEGP